TPSCGTSPRRHLRPDGRAPSPEAANRASRGRADSKRRSSYPRLTEIPAIRRGMLHSIESHQNHALSCCSRCRAARAGARMTAGACMNLRLRRPRLRTPRRVRLALAAVLLLAGVAATCAPSIHERNAVHLLKANSEVNPVMERYIDRGIDEAERTDATAVVIRLDTPGGLSTSMEHIVQRIQP